MPKFFHCRDVVEGEILCLKLNQNFLLVLPTDKSGGAGARHFRVLYCCSVESMYFYVGVHKVFLCSIHGKVYQLLVCVQKRCKNTLWFSMK